MTNLEKAKRIYDGNKKLFEELGIQSFKKVHEELQQATWIKTLEGYGYTELSNKQFRADTEIFLRINDYMYIASMGEKYRRTISWPADGRQPTDEVMLCIGFPTGAYIFGEDYPQKLFQEFFEELKSFGYKYADDVNHYIYFPVETGAKAANEFKVVRDKYYERYKSESNKRRAEKLREELRRLED